MMHHRFKYCVLSLWLLLAPVCGLADEPEKPPESKTFVGKWNNQKYGTSGDLKCVAKPGADGQVNATFSGKFQGEDFSYDVTFNTRPGRGQTDLAGKATVSGHLYEWQGALKGTQLTGRYTCTAGYFGGFTLRQQ